VPDISVVIPTHNRLETLQHVIPSLLAQTLAPQKYEILVADSLSSDGTAEYLTSQKGDGPRVRHLPGAYTGRAAARNAGINAARGEVVLFNDADIIASPNLLEVHAACHRRAERIAIVGLEVQVRDLHDYRRKRDHSELRNPLHKPTRSKLSWLYFLTGNASVRRAHLLAAGSFDESFTGYGHEDLELGYRLEKWGVTIGYEPRAVSYHLQDVPHEDQVEKMKLAGKSTVRFYRKHPHFSVMARLGMTPVSLGLHGLLTRAPWLLGYFDRRAGNSAFARNLLQQYYYVSGIKAALGEKS